MTIVAHHLVQLGYEVTIAHDRFLSFAPWFLHYHFVSMLSDEELLSYDWVIVENDNSHKITRLIELRKQGLFLSIIYLSYNPLKHMPLQKEDFCCNPRRTFVSNMQFFCQTVLKIPQATQETGITIPSCLQHKKYPKRVAIHPFSSDPKRNWPLKKFFRVAKKLDKHGFEPLFLFSPQDTNISSFIPHKWILRFHNLPDLASAIYESSYFIGNDSGPAHLASLFSLSPIVIYRKKHHISLWQPGWHKGICMVPSSWVPNLKLFRIRDKTWRWHIKAEKICQNIIKNN